MHLARLNEDVKQSNESMKETVCVDLDGLLATHDRWRGHDYIGKPIDGAKKFMEELSEIANPIILSARVSGRLEAAKTIEDWLVEHGIPYYSVWTGRGKPKAVAYADDRGVNCDPQHDTGAFTAALKQIKTLLKREI